MNRDTMRIAKAMERVGSADELIYVARFVNHWGVGASVDEAVRNARKVGGRGKDYYVVVLPAGAYDIRVDCMGAVHWSGPTDSATIVKASGYCAKKLSLGGAE